MAFRVARARAKNPLADAARGGMLRGTALLGSAKALLRRLETAVDAAQSALTGSPSDGAAK